MRGTIGSGTRGLLAMAAAMVSLPAVAQSASSGHACYQPRPLPACRSYWVTEFGGALYSSSPKATRIESDRRFVFTWEAGYMRNVPANRAVGGTVFLTGNDQYMRSGVRARVRQWLNRDVAVEVAPSLIVFQANGDLEVANNLPGVSLMGGLTLNRWLGVTSELESTQGGVRLVSGVRLGSYAGATAGLATPAVLFLMGGLLDDS